MSVFSISMSFASYWWWFYLRLYYLYLLTILFVILNGFSSCPVVASRKVVFMDVYHRFMFNSQSWPSFTMPTVAFCLILYKFSLSRLHKKQICNRRPYHTLYVFWSFMAQAYQSLSWLLFNRINHHKLSLLWFHRNQVL